MLSGKEKYLMNYILERAEPKGACLMRRDDMLSSMKKQFPNDGDLERTLRCIEMDGYIETVITEREQEVYYCITLLGKGRYFRRELVDLRRQVWFKVALTVGTALFGVFLTRVLLAILS